MTFGGSVHFAPFGGDGIAMRQLSRTGDRHRERDRLAVRRPLEARRRFGEMRDLRRPHPPHPCSERRSASRSAHRARRRRCVCRRATSARRIPARANAAASRRRSSSRRRLPAVVHLVDPAAAEDDLACRRERVADSVPLPSRDTARARRDWRRAREEWPSRRLAAARARRDERDGEQRQRRADGANGPHKPSGCGTR